MLRLSRLDREFVFTAAANERRKIANLVDVLSDADWRRRACARAGTSRRSPRTCSAPWTTVYQCLFGWPLAAGVWLGRLMRLRGVARSCRRPKSPQVCDGTPIAGLVRRSL